MGPFLVCQSVRNSSRRRCLDELHCVQLCPPASLDDSLSLDPPIACRNGEDNIVDLLPQVCLRCAAQVRKQQRHELLGAVGLLLSAVSHTQDRLVVLATFQARRPVPGVPLNAGVVDPGTDEALRSKKGVFHVRVHLRSGAVAYQHSLFGEGHPRRRHQDAVLVGDQGDIAFLPNAHAHVGGA
mmetsp:Transcript_37800/g.87802  ORF Transcript_37800/g.87802 Transcript_37800/m.87802 type:complete len:183 (-) Transcript_37800:226-774(-)